MQCDNQKLVPMNLEYVADEVDGLRYQTTPNNHYEIVFSLDPKTAAWDAIVFTTEKNPRQAPAAILKKPWQLITLNTPPTTSKYYQTFTRFLHQTGYGICQTK